MSRLTLADTQAHRLWHALRAQEVSPLALWREAARACASPVSPSQSL